MRRCLVIALALMLVPALALAQSTPLVTIDSGKQIEGVGTGTTAAVTATLAAVAGKTTYICGFTITAGATAAAAGSATVTGLASTLTYQQAVGTATAPVKTTDTFTPCLPASATNTSIVVTSAAAGAGGVTDVNAWGYQK